MDSLKKGILFFLSALYVTGCNHHDPQKEVHTKHYQDSVKIEEVLSIISKGSFQLAELQEKLNDSTQNKFKIYGHKSSLTSNGIIICAQDTPGYQLFTSSAHVKRLKKYSHKNYFVWKDTINKNSPYYALEPHPTLGRIFAIRNIVN